MPAPSITALPAAPQRTQATTEFAATADAWAGALPTWTSQTNSLAAWMEQRAADAETAASDTEALAAAVDLAASQAANGLPLVTGHPGEVLTVAADESAVGWAPALPAGVVLWVAAETAPAGTLKANGAAVGRVAYARLFGAIGTRFGAGDGTTTFALPDLRGQFARGWDDSRGVDAGRVLGSAQSGAVEGHTHGAGTLATATAGGHAHYESSIQIGATTGPQTIRAAGNETRGAHTHTITGSTDSTGGAETRPRNVALLAVITY